jgi:hypothetical protein
MDWAEERREGCAVVKREVGGVVAGSVLAQHRF